MPTIESLFNAFVTVLVTIDRQAWRRCSWR